MSKILLPFIAIVIFGCQDEKVAGKPIAQSSDTINDSISLATSLPVEDLIYPIDTVILKDLNGDNVDDTVFVNLPSIIEAELTCRDDVCNTKFIFSNSLFPSFNHEQALGGEIGNAGDLDGDGMCELYFVPDWFTSNWTGLNIYSLQKGSWILLGQGSIRRDVPEMESDLYTPYSKRIIKHKGYFEILENSMDGDGNERLVPKKINLNK